MDAAWSLLYSHRTDSSHPPPPPVPAPPGVAHGAVIRRVGGGAATLRLKTPSSVHTSPTPSPVSLRADNRVEAALSRYRAKACQGTAKARRADSEQHSSSRLRINLLAHLVGEHGPQHLLLHRDHRFVVLLRLVIVAQQVDQAVHEQHRCSFLVSRRRKGKGREGKGIKIKERGDTTDHRVDSGKGEHVEWSALCTRRSARRQTHTIKLPLATTARTAWSSPQKTAEHNPPPTTRTSSSITTNDNPHSRTPRH